LGDLRKNTILISLIEVFGSVLETLLF